MVRRDAGEPQLLLVRSSDGRHWVLPKGHIDPGETPRQAALREVREEAGVVGAITSELGVDRYERGAESVRALYFLMDFEEEVGADEDRVILWVPAEDAAEHVVFAGSRALLLEAGRRLRGPGTEA